MSQFATLVNNVDNLINLFDIFCRELDDRIEFPDNTFFGGKTAAGPNSKIWVETYLEQQAYNVVLAIHYRNKIARTPVTPEIKGIQDKLITKITGAIKDRSIRKLIAPPIVDNTAQSSACNFLDNVINATTKFIAMSGVKDVDPMFNPPIRFYTLATDTGSHPFGKTSLSNIKLDAITLKGQCMMLNRSDKPAVNAVIDAALRSSMPWKPIPQISTSAHGGYRKKQSRAHRRKYRNRRSRRRHN